MAFKIHLDIYLPNLNACLFLVKQDMKYVLSGCDPISLRSIFTFCMD